jgi:cobalt-zinc-cadmium efflux system protein
MSNSLALLADAGHNLGDVLGFAAAWAASILSARHPAGRYTYGLRRTSILAALANAVILLVITGGIAWEGIRRLFEPEEPGGTIIMVVAAVGIAVNGVTALLFMAGRKGDLNIKGAFLHMASDALVSAGTVAAGALILWTGWGWIDPVVSLVISAVIVSGTWSLLRDSVNLSLDAVPEGIDRDAVKTYLRDLPDIAEVHDLHIWGLSTTECALTVHLVHPGETETLLRRIPDELKHRFGIGHATIQFETPETAKACKLSPADVV